MQTLAERMHRAVRVGARYEQRTHGYQNRTGNLEASTDAIILSESNDGAVVQLTMGTRPDKYGRTYAEAVFYKGLSNIDLAAEVAEQQIMEMFDQLLYDG